MARFTVHVPGFAGSREGALERSLFLRDGWSWGAFFFGPFWLLRHRHWVAGLLALAGTGGLLFLVAVLPVPDWSKNATLLLIAVLYGLEGTTLRRLALARAGYSEEAVVIGKARETLELRFFAALSGSDPVVPARAPQASSPVPALQPPAVIGLFPDARKRP
jgi:hypothetical protein